jgi:hypothetical protein
VLRFPAVTTTGLRIWQPAQGGCPQRPDTLWLAEVEVFGRDQNANLLRAEPKAEIKVDSCAEGYSSSRLNDGMRNDRRVLNWLERGWCSASANAPHWVEFRFPKSVEIARVDIYWCRERFGYATSRDFWLEAWDGRQWAKIPSVEREGTARPGDAEKAAFSEQEAELATEIYPFACVTSADHRAGISLGIPPDSPCIYRIAYLRSERSLEITFKFGLSQLPKNGALKGRAPFRFILFRADGAWGFRDAARRYYEFFSETFRRRTDRDGLWMLGRTASAPNPGYYAFHEGGPGLWELDDIYGIYTCPYVLVGQREFESTAKDYTEAMKALAALDPSSRSFYGPGLKEIIENCSLRDAKGRHILLMRRRGGSYDGPAVVTFPMNPNPNLFPDTEKRTAGRETLEYASSLIKQFPGLDGIYVDSLSSWGAYLNSRREHFAYADLPLTHDDAGHVVLDNHLSHVEFLRELRARLEAKGKILFANGIRMKRAWCGFLCDVLGVEANPSAYKSHSQYAFFRTVAYHKPFVLLFTYDWPKPDLPREAVEEYVQSSVAFGIAPESREHIQYAQRDADLYDKFMPILRQIARAGWEPVTYARASDPRVWLERFGVRPGAGEGGNGLFFTLYNPTTEALGVTVQFDNQALHVASECSVKEIVSGSDWGPVANLKLELPPKTLKVLQVGDAPPPPTPPKVTQEEVVERLVSTREKSNANGGGLLTNGGFEEADESGRATGWAFRARGNAAAELTPTQARSGQRALFIRDEDDKGYADGNQAFEFVRPGWRYTLSLWVKQAPNSKNTGRFYYQWRKGSERLQQGRFDFPRAAEWTRCEWTLEPPAGATSLHIALGCSIPEAAEVFVDDVSLARERKPGK